MATKKKKKKKKKKSPSERSATSKRENPLGKPYRFEGFGEGSVLATFPHVLGPPDDGLAGVTLAVVRAGENDYGTWGEIQLWNGKSWDLKGFTLEPRGSVGKGPIPLGAYSYVRWNSPTLKKTLRLANVPGFTDILVHVGNTQDDTKGCILAAKKIDSTTKPTRLDDSRTLIDWLYDNCESGTIQFRST